MIVGLASYGRSVYEDVYNSGIGSNGLTSARHDALSKYYAASFKESYDNGLADEVVYIGKHRLTDPFMPPGTDQQLTDIGHLLLSPTRTFAPVMKELLSLHFDKIHGLIHCSGGGQTKCMKYLPGNFKVIKDHLFDPPPVFTLLQQNSGSSLREMYEVYNMGCRIEIYCKEENAAEMIAVAGRFGIEARVIGRVEENVKKSVEIRLKETVIVY